MRKLIWIVVNVITSIMVCHLYIRIKFPCINASKEVAQYNGTKISSRIEEAQRYEPKKTLTREEATEKIKKWIQS
jgi:hypothetical protein